MRCFVYLINQVDNKETKFAIEIPDGCSVYDLYRASLIQAIWSHLLEAASEICVQAEKYEKDFSEFGDIQEEEIDKILVEPNSRIRFIIEKRKSSSKKVIQEKGFFDIKIQI